MIEKLFTFVIMKMEDSYIQRDCESEYIIEFSGIICQSPANGEVEDTVEEEWP